MQLEKPKTLSPALALGPDKLLTSAEVADLLTTTPMQVDNMRKRGQGPAAHKVPGLGWRWRESAVRAWVDSVAPGPAAPRGRTRRAQA